MINLPYIQPDRELNYNIGILLIILEKLALTKRKKYVLTFDKLQTFYFLVSRPVFLNKVLSIENISKIDIREVDFYTVHTLSVNVDDLYDRQRLQTLLKILSSEKLLTVGYSKTDGFLFSLSETGKARAARMNEGYFKKIRTYAEQLSTLQSKSPPMLNGLINTVLKQGI